jgi:tetratricopeptide (TPR) repeat protein
MRKILYIVSAVLLICSCKQIQEENNQLVLNPSQAISFDASKDMLDKSIQDNANSDILYFKRAQLYLNENFLELALYDIDKAIKLEKVPKYFFLKGKILSALNDTTGLDYCLKQYEKTTIDDYEYYLLKSELLYKKHFYRKALDEINAGIRIAPFFNQFYKRKGLVYLALKDTLKGEKYLLQAYSDDSSIVDNYFELSRFYENVGQYGLSDKYLNNGLKLDTSHYGLNLLKGNNFYKKKKYDSAVVYYDKSIVRNPKYEESVYQRAKLYMDMFRYIAAQADWQRVLKLNPHNETAYKYLAICYLENGDWVQSEHLFNNILKKDTANVEIKGYLLKLKNTQQKLAINPNQNAILHKEVKPKLVARDTINTIKVDSLR